MSRGNRVLVNLSESGANVYDINRIAHEFYKDNAELINRVDRVAVNIGTNDIKWFNGRKYSVYRKFRSPLVKFVQDIKFMFPQALIIFVSVLPIRAFYNYTADTVHMFNRLLIDVCSNLGCIFFDCFREFLSHDYRDHNFSLFRDKWHLNDTGLRVLCRALKYNVVHGKIFNPRMRGSFCPNFY